MRRAIALVLCLVMCLGLCACSGGKKKVENVENLINEIGTVSLNSGDAINAAREAYNELDDDLKDQVTNYDQLTAAESEYDLAVRLDANTIEYEPISSKNPDMLEFDIEKFYSNQAAAASMFILFQLQGMKDGYVETEKLHMDEEHVAINREDGRVDIYAPYDEGLIMGIQYWPDQGKAQIGTVETDLTIDEFLDLMVEGGVIDEYADIPLSVIGQVLSKLQS